jgi:hypothetical protein
MKKKRMKRILIGCVVVLLLALLVIGLQVLNRSAKRPFKNLKVSQVKEIYFDDIMDTYVLNEEEKEEFLELLSDVVIYEKKRENTPMAKRSDGTQGKVRIVKKTGREVKVSLGHTAIRINGRLYRMEYYTEAAQFWRNKIMQEYEKEYAK